MTIGCPEDTQARIKNSASGAKARFFGAVDGGAEAPPLRFTSFDNRHEKNG
jgi:hypothetical protein